MCLAPGLNKQEVFYKQNLQVGLLLGAVGQAGKETLLQLVPTPTEVCCEQAAGFTWSSSPRHSNLTWLHRKASDLLLHRPQLLLKELQAETSRPKGKQASS